MRLSRATSNSAGRARPTFPAQHALFPSDRAGRPTGRSEPAGQGRATYFANSDALTADLQAYSAHPWTLGSHNEHHPLLSQPLIETCLRIPVHLLATEGWDRAVARRAFSTDLPAEVYQRIVDVRKLERALPGSPSQSTVIGGILTTLLYTEAWVRARMRSAGETIA